MRVCLSHGGPNVYQSDIPPTELLVATTNGLNVLERDGPAADWQLSRVALEGKHVSALLHEPTRDVLFAGTHDAGLYASLDRGLTWQRRDQGVASENIFSLNQVRVGDQVRLYVGTEPAHLYVSLDLGERWRELPGIRSVPSTDRWSFPGPPHVAHLKNVAIDPADPDTIYAAVEVGGLLKSTDGGERWRELIGIGQEKTLSEDVHRVMIERSQPASVYISSGNGIYHSQDAGETFEQLTDRSMRIGYPDALVLHPEREGLLFTAGALHAPSVWRFTGGADGRIARSRDGGKTWQVLGFALVDGNTQVSGLPPYIHGNIEAMSMSVWPGGFSLFAGTTDGDVFLSEDEGESWPIIARGLSPVSKGMHWRLFG
jgi:photosystem II stability/assembly factor-like uncharacterized protein